MDAMDVMVEVAMNLVGLTLGVPEKNLDAWREKTLAVDTENPFTMTLNLVRIADKHRPSPDLSAVHTLALMQDRLRNCRNSFVEVPAATDFERGMKSVTDSLWDLIS